MGRVGLRGGEWSVCLGQGVPLFDLMPTSLGPGGAKGPLEGPPVVGGGGDQREERRLCGAVDGALPAGKGVGWGGRGAGSWAVCRLNSLF